ncbi:MAG: hypothetical protein UY77_C0034G0021 [Candidatus Uhrbacteria bacterium GW2011_GWA2_53_10]|uniref:Resolvase helix-turn-helix domain protein n=1 Tax=Candidatus Uhrbacteria bacterium GW2011_GWA2_53_10 TaxID=1618980 RepID=A0A0G1XML9_9BACT|nr:MAG: hypothetical protein UY77_C0034G0021 [Candidatus Uhrbacteria bacterium GW2011_GWA2_53_10]
MNNAVKDQFVELRAQGISFAVIAERLGVSKTTLIGWSKDMREDIVNLRQIHFEALREKHRLGAERRMELFAKQLDTVEAELGKRDLTTVSTDRLFDVLVKLGRELDLVTPPMTFQRRVNGLELDLSSTHEWQA